LPSTLYPLSYLFALPHIAVCRQPSSFTLYLHAGKIDEYGVIIEDPDDYDPDDPFSKTGILKIRAALEGDDTGSRLTYIFKYFQLEQAVSDAVFSEVLFLLKSRQRGEEQVVPWFQTLLNRHSYSVVSLMEAEGHKVAAEMDEFNDSETEEEEVAEEEMADGEVEN
jgi:hypothetical protein